MQPEHARNPLLASRMPEGCCTSVSRVDPIGRSRFFELRVVLISTCSRGFSSLLEPVCGDRAGMRRRRYALRMGTQKRETMQHGPYVMRCCMTGGLRKLT